VGDSGVGEPGVPGPGDGRPSGTCGRACPAAFCSARASKA